MKRNYHGHIMLLAMGACALLITGCWGTAGIDGIAGVSPAIPPGLALSTSVEVNNAGLARAVEIADIRASRTENGLLKGSVAVKSKKSSTLKMQYKFVWFDTVGQPVEPEASAWKPVIIYGKETKSLLGVAPNATVSQFRLKLRWAD